VDLEVVGDHLYVQEPKDKQRESGHADEASTTRTKRANR